MSVKLCLKRIGKRHRPCYRVCVMDQRTPRDGRYIESIGFYDPLIEDDMKKVRIDKERAEYWLSVGAQPSETVASFLRKAHVQGLIKPKKPRKRRPTKKKTAKATASKKPEKKTAKKSAKKTSKKTAKSAKKK